MDEKVERLDLRFTFLGLELWDVIALGVTYYWAQFITGPWGPIRSNILALLAMVAGYFALRQFRALMTPFDLGQYLRWLLLPDRLEPQPDQAKPLVVDTGATRSASPRVDSEPVPDGTAP